MIVIEGDINNTFMNNLETFRDVWLKICSIKWSFGNGSIERNVLPLSFKTKNPCDVYDHKFDIASINIIM